MSGNIKVAVRCASLFSALAEIARGATGLIRMEGKTTYLSPPPEDATTVGKAIEKETKAFSFDHSYWSAGSKDDPDYASQHTVYLFTLIMTQKKTDPDIKMASEKVSRISLIDLAGSERANSTGATGVRLKEGANINKSLTTLGKVISALATQSTATTKKKGGAEHIPYRDSVLTWLLKDSIGGNSKTAMIAAISPADYDETLSTLRYADQAKKIKNQAVVNEDPNAKLIRELKEELEAMRKRVALPPGQAAEAFYDKSVPAEKQMVVFLDREGKEQTISKAEMQEKMESAEKLMAEINQSWEEKIQKTKVVQEEREKALEELGISIEKNVVGVFTPKKAPHLVNLNEDPLMSECLLYQIKPGKTIVGNLESAADIRLSGTKVLAEHCHFQCSPDMKEVTIQAMENSATMVNGQRLNSGEPRKLKSGYRIILGDFHVFRFNNPEQARIDRDARQSKLPHEIRSPGLSGFEDDNSRTSSPMTRPESPVSTASEVVDWEYAKNEARQKLPDGHMLDLESLPDDDLNSLYQKVVRTHAHRRGTSVGRPDSRMSLSFTATDDDDDSGDSPSNRPSSSSNWTNDDSMDSTMTYSGTTVSEGDRYESAKEEIERRLEVQKQEYERRIESMANGESDEIQQEKIKLVQNEMQRMLDIQKKHYETRVKKLLAKRKAEDDDFEFVHFTDDQKQLIKRALVRWRRNRRVRMAEDIMAHAIVVKEANVISRELDKDVTYQLMVLDQVFPASALETITGLMDLDEVTDQALESASKPCVAVKVLDRRNKAVYVWSLDKLNQRLQQMRNLNNFIDKPEYSANFDWDAPFYEAAPLSHSYIGSAIISLKPLSRFLLAASTASVYSRYSSEPIATCRIRLQPTHYSPEQAITLEAGVKMTVEITVDKVSGLHSSDFASLHCQLRISSIAGTVTTPDDNLVSNAFPTSSLSKFRMKKSVTIGVTAEIAQYIQDGYATVHFFAEPKHGFFDRMEQWDEMREGAGVIAPRGVEPAIPEPVARRNETELVLEQRHDVLAMIQICELSAEGSYDPVPVVAVNTLDPGAFYLRQGLQRRLIIRLSHNSGRQFPWTKFLKVELGNARLLDPRGRVHSAEHGKDTILRSITRQTCQFQPDGSSELTFVTSWDSSVHESIFLDRTTAQNHRALLALSWQVDVPRCKEPVTFMMDIAVTMQNRDARPPSKIASFLSSTRILSKATALFCVRLIPFTPKKTAEIWRLNTAGKFVRGEDILGKWKPRGLTLIKDFNNAAVSERRSADVDATQAILGAMSRERLTSYPPAPDPNALLQKALALWSKRFGPVNDIVLAQDPSPSKEPELATPLPPEPQRKRKKMVPEVRLIPRTDVAARRGFLSVLRDPTSDEWVKQYFVLKRPYLFCYETSSELEELSVVNVSSVRVDNNLEVEAMLGRKNIFAMYTPQNCYFFQAANPKDLKEWCDKIDPSRN
ncbi:hypothetical protein BT69DRAFT_1310065 [Atractiella rhizophila]|nr:hypothetical protein BT69DRAFT_1310065 [Atractiella rhizophila]